MFENLISNDIGGALKKISKFLFYFCLIIGAILIIIGIIRFLSGIGEYASFSEGIHFTSEDAITYGGLYANCYYGRLTAKIGFGIALSSLGAIPMYALGELVSYVKKINEILSKTNNN